MWRQWLPATGFSLAIHVALLGLLGFSLLKRPAPPPTPVSHAQPVEAVAVDARAVEAELERLRADERARQAREEAKRRQLAEEQRQAREARQREQARLAALKQQRAEEERRRQAEAQRLAKLKAEQEALAEKRRREEARLAELERQRKIEAEKRRREAEEARRREEEARRQAEIEQALRAEMEAESRRLAAERHSQQLAARAEYASLIADKVGRNWLRPSGTPDDFSCKVLVRQIPGGEVVGVEMKESCGSPALDRSVEAAVRKASPLPEPPDPDVFEREIEFTFIPRG